MHFISPEPRTVLARRQSINMMSSYWHSLSLHICMFNFQNINIRLPEKFIYIVLSVFTPEFHPSHGDGLAEGSERSVRMYATRLPTLSSVTLSPGTVDRQIPVVNLCLVLFFDVAAMPFLYFIWSGLSVRWKHIMDTILNWPPQRHSAVLGSLACVTEHSQLVYADYLPVKQSLFG